MYLAPGVHESDYIIPKLENCPFQLFNYSLKNLAGYSENYSFFTRLIQFRVTGADAKPS